MKNPFYYEIGCPEGVIRLSWRHPFLMYIQSKTGTFIEDRYASFCIRVMWLGLFTGYRPVDRFTNGSPNWQHPRWEFHGEVGLLGLFVVKWTIPLWKVKSKTVAKTIEGLPKVNAYYTAKHLKDIKLSKST